MRPVAAAGQVLRETAVLVRAGVLRPGRPDRTAREVYRLARLGPTLAGGYAVAAARAPHRVAVSDESTSRTFGELDTRVRAIARGLAAHGAGPGTAVALLGVNSVAFVEALVAVSRVGADALLLSTFLSPVQAQNVLEKEQPVLVLSDPELLPLLAHRPVDVPLVLTRSDPAGGASPHDDGTRTLDDLAASPGPRPARLSGRRRGRLVVLTSGTTGTPKGARRPPPANLGPAASMLSRLRLRAGDSIMISTPLFHTWGLGILQIAPALAAGVVLRRRADPALVLEAVSSHRCTALVAVPVVLERLLHLDPAVRAAHDTGALRLVASSGSALTGDLASAFQDAFGDVLYNVYGSTENSWATIADPADLRAAPGTAGRPPLGTVVRVLTEDGTPAATGEIGRIVVGNHLMFEGYTDGSTRAVDHGLMATGDRGYLDHGGRLMVVGRDDDLVISGAEKIYPLEVEQVIAALPQVREVAVLGRPDPEMGQRLVAFVACHDAGTGQADALTAEDVRDHVRRRLARFAVPRDVHFVDALPRTPTGKVVRRLLPADAPAAGGG